MTDADLATKMTLYSLAGKVVINSPAKGACPFDGTAEPMSCASPHLRSSDKQSSQTAGHRLTRRHVYHLTGYDPIDCDAQYRRFARQLQQFEHTWTARASISEIVRSSEQCRAWWTVQAYGADWQVETVHELLLWSDIVRADLAR